MKRRQITPQLIDKMVRRLARRFKPEQIILFGSHARGTAGPDSDVDLLVVMPLENPRHEKRNLELAMRLALHDIKSPTDIIVVTPHEIEKHKNISGTIVHTALREGETLYVRRS